MVGTAVYQVGRNASSQAKNFSASKPGAHTTLDPAMREERIAPITPWIWKSGMMLRERSFSVSWREAAMLRAEAKRLEWVRGTLLGREVVPEVCSTRARSSAWAKPS